MKTDLPERIFTDKMKGFRSYIIIRLRFALYAPLTGVLF